MCIRDSDGTEETEIVCERVDDDGFSIGSLVDVVHRALDPEDELATLLVCVSAFGGRLAERPPYLGFLLPEELRRAATLLDGMVFASAEVERDRRLLSRLLAIAQDAGVGLYWLGT